MNKSTLISIDTFCQMHNLEIELISSFHDFGLISILFKNEQAFIEIDELGKLEKIINFHNELEINKEGIEVIFKLLEKISTQQSEINQLYNKLRLTEN